MKAERCGNTADRNVTQKEAERKLKYKSLCMERHRMCNIKCTIIPAIIGATGIATGDSKNVSESHTREMFKRFTTKYSYARKITHNAESAAV